MATSAPSGVSFVPISRDVFARLEQSDRLLTARELAVLLAVSPKTLYNYVSRNLIPYYKIESNVRFRGKDIAEWLRQRAA
jgi:excisionase family DNA binding protein